tara:strand:+ start:165 stop:1085 length:921 start_codon:yes stop_codon:yes gene_type:complete
MKQNSDIAKGDWIDQKLPSPVQPYLRLARVDRPIGIWLLAIPCWWGMGLACNLMNIFPSWDAAVLALIFLIGATLMRSAGCTWNDILDRHIDSKVSRTASRPLASGAISVARAIIFMGLLLLVSASILVTLNEFTRILATSSLILVAIYPAMKRITFWPQAFLGITFNWGVLVGFAAITGTLMPATFVLYAAAFFWTLGYDTIYAHQDKEDDALIGVMSTALKFGSTSKAWISGFYILAMTCFVLTGLLADLGPTYFLLLAVPAGLLTIQVYSVNLDDPKSCLLHFRANTQIGCWILAALVIGQLP